MITIAIIDLAYSNTVLVSSIQKARRLHNFNVVPFNQTLMKESE